MTEKRKEREKGSHRGSKEKGRKGEKRGKGPREQLSDGGSRGRHSERQKETEGQPASLGRDVQSQIQAGRDQRD